MRQRRDYRKAGFAITLVAIAAVGLLLSTLPAPRPAPLAEKKPSNIAVAEQHSREAREQEIAVRFQQAVAMLHAHQYDFALKALHRVLDLSPRMPEAHVNMGYALVGLKQYPAARDFFRSAIELRPEQVNAYYGLAISLEQLGDLPGALGAMRTYVHLSKGDSRYRRRAESAIWEWQATLKKQSKMGSVTAPPKP